MDGMSRVFTLLKHIPAILWNLLIGLLQWFVPRSLYAKDVSKDIILITGAGSGLGRAIALEFAKLNASLVLWDINQNGLEETRALVEQEHRKCALKMDKTKEANQQEKTCSTYIVDVSNRQQIYSTARQVHKDLNSNQQAVGGGPDEERYVSVLVNNAGIYHGLYLTDLTDAQIERIFKINILAHFWTVRAFLPQMMKHNKGHIVEIASMGGIVGLFKQVDYSSTKFATVGFEESLSIELDHLGYGKTIRTTSVCPFFFNSNLFTGYDSRAASIMSSNYVAKEAVLTMRCNHARVLLPKLQSYPLSVLRTMMPRSAIFLWTRALGLDKSIREIKGYAATTAAAQSC